jgi:predicted enzyme related to lactoylglutathione lyase
MGFAYSEVFIALADLNYGTLIDFYQSLFQQEPVVTIPNVYAEFQLIGLRLGIFNPNADHQLEFQAASSGGMSLCLEVTNLEDAIAHLTQLGYPPPGTITTASHGREIYAYDPAGNRLILHQATKK